MLLRLKPKSGELRKANQVLRNHSIKFVFFLLIKFVLMNNLA